MLEAKILFVATDLSTGGGVNKVIRDLAVLLKEKLGARTEVVSARSERPSTYEFPASVPVKYHRARSLPAYLAVLWRLRRERPDYVIGPWTQDNVMIVLAFLLSPSRLVLVEHSPWHFQGAFLRLLRRLLYPLAWRVVVLNPTELAHYRRYLGNVRLLPNPVPEIVPVSRAPREKLIVAIGHLEPHKNFADAIRAMARSGLERESWSLVLIGAGSEEERLRALIVRLGLKRTSLEPPTADLASWYARASLIVSTARIEVFSLVLAEAMLAGVIPIAYAADGPRFLLEDFSEHLVNLGEVDGLAERLSHFTQQSDLAPLRERLRASIQQRFSPDAIADQWRELFA